MAQLPDRPDLRQLRRQAKELHRAAMTGDHPSVRRVRAVSGRTNLAAAQLVVARDHGFESWPSLRAALELRRFGGFVGVSASKHDKAAVYRAADFISSAQRTGWDSGPVPVGAVFTSQSFITAHLEQHANRYRPSENLTPPNGQVFLTARQAPVAIACLGIGATPLVALLEQLVALGVRSFIAVGPAPALGADLVWGDCVVIDRALRDDGISHHYLPPARYAFADRALTEKLRLQSESKGLRPRVGSTWTVPTPYRTTAEELILCEAEGVAVTELTTAALFAVALAAGAKAASAVVATRGPTQRNDAGAPAPPPRMGRLFHLLEAAIGALEGEVTA